MSKFLFLFLFMVFCLSTNAQCPFEKENCTGECGRFIDENKDGFCDFGLVTKPAQKTNPEKQDSIDKSPKFIPYNENKPANKVLTKPAATATPAVDPKTPVDSFVQIILASDTISNNEKANIAGEAQIQNKQPKEKPYDFLLISLITIALYVLTMFLVKIKKLKKTSHRKIWNVILLVSFLVSGILGLILVGQINYGFAMPAFRDFLFLHVEFGIVMAIVAVIHAFWHLNYYAKTFKLK